MRRTEERFAKESVTSLHQTMRRRRQGERNIINRKPQISLEKSNLYEIGREDDVRDEDGGGLSENLNGCGNVHDAN